MAMIKESKRGREKQGLVFRYFTFEEITEITNLTGKTPAVELKSDHYEDLYEQGVSSAERIGEAKESILEKALQLTNEHGRSLSNTLLDMIYNHYWSQLVDNGRNPEQDELKEFAGSMNSVFSLVKFINNICDDDDYIRTFKKQINLAKKGVLL